MLAVAVLVTVLVLVNLENIKSSKPFQNAVEKVEKGKDAFGQMMELRSELMSQFPAENMQMTITGDVLVIQVVNPSFLEGEQAHARHILIRTAPGASQGDRVEARTRAEGVFKIAETGADFGELAAKHSADPGSKDSGGDLGWFGRGQMVKEFEDAVWGGKPGDILGPVESQFGYHIIRVEARRRNLPQDFEDKKEEYRKSALQRLRAQQWESFSRDLTEQAKVEVVSPELRGWRALLKE